MHHRTRDMTEGNILIHLVMFSIPLLIGNLFQQLYNTVDSIVVGNFVSSQALAAVGASGPVINAIVGGFAGLATGAGVVVSCFFGAKNMEKLSRAYHTTILMTLFMAVFFTVLGYIAVPFMVRLMSTPEDVVLEASTYLRIYFLGLPALLLYNMGSGLMRAVGDSSRPLIFLCITSGCNIVFDLLFVLVFHLGVSGVAYATILSEAISAICVLRVMTSNKEVCRLEIRKLTIDGEILRQIFRIGLPAALQTSVTSFSNVIVQGYINQYGSAVMAGWGAYGKLDQFALLPMQSFSLANTTFTGQNLGAGKWERLKKGRTMSLAISIISTAVICVFLSAFAERLAAMFTQDPAVISNCATLLRLISPFYVFCCINQIYAGTLRGVGDATAPMVIMLSSFVVFRQIYLGILQRIGVSFEYMAFGYPAGWLLCSTVLLIYFMVRQKQYHGRYQKG